MRGVCPASLPEAVAEIAYALGISFGTAMLRLVRGTGCALVVGQGIAALEQKYLGQAQPEFV